jgi:lipopolysaccharide transport system ATP-binding protein
VSPAPEQPDPAGAVIQALQVQNVSKTYTVWRDPTARLKVPCLRLLSRRVRPLRRRIEPHLQGLYREFNALQGISFTLPRGTSMAIIGRNGSGKSTLLQIIAGTLQASGGSVVCTGRVAALLELGSGFNPELTGRANVFMNGAIYGLEAEEIGARMHEIEAFAEIGDFIDQPVKTYSSGMMMRLAFSVQILLDPDVLIVDEALSVGDIFFQQKCFERMRRLSEAGTSILFVSHDLVTVSQFTDVAMVLDHGRCAFFGKSSVAVKEYQILERSAAAPPGATPPQTSSRSSAAGRSLPSSPSTQVSKPPGSAKKRIRVSPLAEIPLSNVLQVGRDRAAFTRITLSDEEGNPCSIFEQGSRMYIQCDVLTQIHFDCMSVGISIKDRTNVFVHGKHSIQHGIRSGPLEAGTEVGFQFSFVLELAPGAYSMDIGIIDIHADLDRGIPSDMTESSLERICLNDGFASFQVAPRSSFVNFQLPFFGLTDMAGDCLLLPAGPESIDALP